MIQLPNLHFYDIIKYCEILGDFVRYGRAGPVRTGPQARPSRARRGRAGRSGQVRAGSGRAGPSQVELGRAGPGRSCKSFSNASICFQICDLTMQCSTNNARLCYRAENTCDETATNMDATQPVRDESATNMHATQPVLPSGEIRPSLIRPGRVFS